MKLLFHQDYGVHKAGDVAEFSTDNANHILNKIGIATYVPEPKPKEPISEPKTKEPIKTATQDDTDRKATTR